MFKNKLIFETINWLIFQFLILLSKAMALLYNQRYLEIFGFCPTEETANGNVDIILILRRSAVLFICIVMALIPSISYILLHPEDTEVLITSLIPIVGFILVVSSYCTFFLEGRTAISAFDHLRTVVNDRKFLPIH